MDNVVGKSFPSYGFTAVLVTCLGVSIPDAYGQEEAPQRRAPIRYDARLQMHEPAPRRDDSERIRDERDRAHPDIRNLTGHQASPTPFVPNYLAPPSPPSAAEQRRRNWILPSMESDELQDWSATDDEAEPSGWGWLADGAQQISDRDAEVERVRTQELEDEEAERAAGNGGMFRDDAPGLWLDPLATTAARFGVMMSTGGRDETERERRGVAADAQSETREEADRAEALRRSGEYAEEAYTPLDPWDAAPVSVWGPDTRERDRSLWQDRRDDRDGVGRNGQSDRLVGRMDMTPDFGSSTRTTWRPMERDQPVTDLSTDRSRVVDPGRSFETSSFGVPIRSEGSDFSSGGSSSDASSFQGAFSGAQWQSGWVGDAGASRSVRPASIDPSPALAPGRGGNGLSDFQSPWLSD